MLPGTSSQLIATVCLTSPATLRYIVMGSVIDIQWIDYKSGTCISPINQGSCWPTVKKKQDKSSTALDHSPLPTPVYSNKSIVACFSMCTPSLTQAPHWYVAGWLNIARSSPPNCTIGPKPGKRSYIACLLYTPGRYDAYLTCGFLLQV